MRSQLIYLLLSLCAVNLIGQELPPEVNVIPPSPNVAALNKYVEIPVSQYTGTPNISVPVYTIQMQQLSLPISLSYHASGLKVEEYASWVGAGWSLNAGGSISRTVRGLPDEYLPATNAAIEGKKGYFYNHKLFNTNGTVDNSWFSLYDGPLTPPLLVDDRPVSTADSLAQSFLDVQPDLYNFNYPGGKGRFVFSRTGEMMRFSKDDIKFIEHPFDDINNMPQLGQSPSATDYKWKIKAPDGTIYTFAKAERTTTHGGCGFGLSAYDDQLNGHESSWHLTEINLNGEWIRFEYVEETIVYDMKLSVNANFKISGSGSPSNSICTNTLDVKTQRLSRIYTSNGIEVTFVPGDNRLDLNGSARLDRIEVRHGADFVSFYKLKYDYFATNAKLRLDEFYQENISGSQSLPGKEFIYYGGAPFPALNSTSQDYWGYYNGAANGSNLIPPYKTGNYHLNQASTVNREPGLVEARNGTLHQIKHATGGTTTLDYELHDYYNANHAKTYVHEVSANGTVGSPETEEVTFVVADQTLATLTLVSNMSPSSFAQLQKQVSGQFVQENLGNTIGNRSVLTPGTYRLYATSNDGADNRAKIEYEQMEAFTAQAGGLRVKTITVDDPETNTGTVKNYEYTQEGSGESSGKLFTPLMHGGAQTSFTTGYLAGNNTACVPDQTVTSINVSSNSQLPSAFYHGSHIGYSRVREYAGNATVTVGGKQYLNGVIDSEFINEVPFLNYGTPFVPAIDLTHKNGKLLKQSVYAYELGYGTDNLRKVKESENIYAEEDYLGERVFAVSFAAVKSYFCYTFSAANFSFNYYELKPTWHYLSQTIEKEFFNGGAEMSTVTDYGYPQSVVKPYYAHDSKQWLNSQGKLMRQEFTRNSNSPALISEVELFREGQKVSGSQMTYHGKLPATIASWEVGSVNDYRMLKRFNFSANKLESIEEYPTSTPGVALGQTTHYLWGYNGRYPVAQIVGDLATFDPSSLIVQSVLDAPASEQALIIELNKLRSASQLEDALITTYTFRPGIGISTMTDTNGFTSSYEYDAFNRLIVVRDQDDNIVKTYNYHYKGQD